MATASISMEASVTIDGEEKQINLGGTISCNAITSGSQTVGSTYEQIATFRNFSTGATLIVYNTGTVDVSIRVSLPNATTNTYQFLNCVAGGIVVIPPYFNESGATPISYTSEVSARTSSGTATLDYCVIR